MLILCIILIVVLSVIYYRRPCENILESLKYSKILLEDINYSYHDKLLLPPILSLKKINIMKIKNKSFPLLFVPDIGGNRLYGKWNVEECNMCIAKSNWYTQIWPISQCLSPFIPFANCWKERFIMNKDFTDRKNIKIIAKNFGSIHDMNMLYNFGKGIAIGFYPLIKSLKAYKDGYNLFGAPYDFRKIANISILEIYFEKIKKLVEFSFKKNKKPIILVGHTLGGILVNIFLNYHVTDNWKQKYIKSFIAIHVPFTGCDIAETAIKYGTNEGIGIRSMAYSTASWYNEIEKYMGGIHLLLKTSNRPNIKKLLFFRNMNPNVKIHFIMCNKDIINITIPKNWDITIYKINTSHKKVVNNPQFLKLFSEKFLI